MGYFSNTFLLFTFFSVFNYCIYFQPFTISNFKNKHFSKLIMVENNNNSKIKRKNFPFGADILLEHKFPTEGFYLDSSRIISKEPHCVVFINILKFYIDNRNNKCISQEYTPDFTFPEVKNAYEINFDLNDGANFEEVKRDTYTKNYNAFFDNPYIVYRLDNIGPYHTYYFSEIGNETYCSYFFNIYNYDYQFFNSGTGQIVFYNPVNYKAIIINGFKLYPGVSNNDYIYFEKYKFFTDFQFFYITKDKNIIIWNGTIDYEEERNSNLVKFNGVDTITFRNNNFYANNKLINYK